MNLFEIFSEIYCIPDFENSIDDIRALTKYGVYKTRIQLLELRSPEEFFWITYFGH